MVDRVYRQKTLSALRHSHLLAISWSRRSGANIVLVIDDNQATYNAFTRDVIPHVERVFVELNSDQLADFEGIHDRAVVEDRYLRRNDPDASFRLITLKGESDLEQFVSEDWDYRLSPLSDREIDEYLETLDLSNVSVEFARV